MFFDIIKNNEDDSKLDADHKEFTKNVSNIKAATRDIKKQILAATQAGNFSSTSGSQVVNSEYVMLLVRNLIEVPDWDTNYTGAQMEIKNLLFPRGFENKSSDKEATDKIFAILLNKIPFELPEDTFQSFIRPTNISPELNVGSQYIHDMQHTLLYMFNKPIEKYFFREVGDDLPEGKNIIEWLESWYEDLYDIFSTHSLDMIHKYLLHKNLPLFSIDYEEKDKARLKWLKNTLFETINFQLRSILFVKDRIKKVIKIIADQLTKMDSLFESISRTGARVEIKRKHDSPSGWTTVPGFNNFDIIIEKGDYFFDTNYINLLRAIECPSLEHKIGSTMCIQPGHGGSEPLFDHLVTIFMLLGGGQKNVLPLLDYFIYFSELGVVSDLSEATSINMEFQPAGGNSKENKQAIINTFKYFINSPDFGGAGAGFHVLAPEPHRTARIVTDSSTLPPINTFINRFRVERRKMRRRGE